MYGCGCVDCFSPSFARKVYCKTKFFKNTNLNCSMQNVIVNKIAGLALCLSLFLLFVASMFPTDAFGQGDGEYVIAQPFFSQNISIESGGETFDMGTSTRNGRVYVELNSQATKRCMAFDVSTDGTSGKIQNITLGFLSVFGDHLHLFYQALRNLYIVRKERDSYGNITMRPTNRLLSEVTIGTITMIPWGDDPVLIIPLNKSIEVQPNGMLLNMKVDAGKQQFTFTKLYDILQSFNTNKHYRHGKGLDSFFKSRIQDNELVLTPAVLHELYLLASSNFKTHEPFIHNCFSLGGGNKVYGVKSRKHYVNNGTTFSVENTTVDPYSSRISVVPINKTCREKYFGMGAILLSKHQGRDVLDVKGLRMSGEQTSLLANVLSDVKLVKVGGSSQKWKLQDGPDVHVVHVDTITWTKQFRFKKDKPVVYRLPVNSYIKKEDIKHLRVNHSPFLREVITLLLSLDDQRVRDVFGKRVSPGERLVVTREVYDKLKRLAELQE